MIKYFIGIFCIAIFLSFNIFSDTSTGNFIIVLKQQVDVSEFNHISGKNNKAFSVWNACKANTDNSQKEIIQFLEKEKISFQSFHIVNAIKIKNVSDDILQKIKTFEEVNYIQEDNLVQITNFERHPNNSNHSRMVEWGISKINADKVWEEFGVSGEGVTVAGQDTGYDWEHSALKEKYRGWDGTSANHNYNWHDAIHEYSPLHSTEFNPCGLDSDIPCDDNGHGTHTMGTMVGKANDADIGVAPNAKWIACRNMDRGYGSPSTYIECFEWFLAPTDLNGKNPDPSRSPHVIANSWGCPEIEGCNPDNFNTMKVVVDNLKAAGIVVVASAGNSGNNGCGSVSNPAAIFESTFSVGASDSNDTLADFSSTGAVLADGSRRLKPNVSAPGVQVRSCLPNDNYATYSGTSMAGPHVAGVVALMISANPQLAGEVEQIETILERTAVPIFARTNECNGTSLEDIPNNIFGYGRIDAYAAVKESMDFSFDYDGGIFLYPNPARNEVNILMEGVEGNIFIDIYDNIGRFIHNEKKAVFGGNTVVDMASLPSGIYFIRIQAENQKWVRKVIKL